MSDDEPAGQLGESVETGPPKVTTASSLKVVGYVALAFAFDAILAVFAIIALWHLPTWAVILVTLALAFSIRWWIMLIRKMRRQWRAVRLARLNRGRNGHDSQAASEGTTSVADGVERRPTLDELLWGPARLTMACAFGAVVAEWATPPVGIGVACTLVAARLVCFRRAVSLRTQVRAAAGPTGS